MREPTITESQVKRMFAFEGPESNLTRLRATNGVFLARNLGLSDDGQNLNLEMIGRIVPDPPGNDQIAVDIPEVAGSPN